MANLSNPRRIQYLMAVSLRTAVPATLSLLAARLLRLPEAYWAAISTIIIMQSTLGAALHVSVQRFGGTALGAAVGALLAAYFGPHWFVFAVGLFALGLISGLLHLDRSGYRYAGVTLAIVLLELHNQSAWIVALHRFVEVAAGIAIALLVSVVWPENPRPNSPRGGVTFVL
jgi:uncharacterized membrane protein YgaE (UPF0421/DUF939 family)